MDGYIGFHAALRRCFNNFIHDLSKQCKQIVQHHLNSVTSPYSQVCYENDLVPEARRYNQLPAASFFPELSDSATDEAGADQENIPPKDQQHSTPDKATETTKDVLRESQLTVPETPSPDQPSDDFGIKKKEIGNLMDAGGRKRQARLAGGRNVDANRYQNNSILFGAGTMGSKTGSSYAEICSMSAQHFARIRQVLIERNVLSALSAGFLTPWYDSYASTFSSSAVGC